METVSNQTTAETAGVEPGGGVAASLVERHLGRISGLLTMAENLAENLLHSMGVRMSKGDTVYPGELIQVCRGLHVLARCGLELRKHLKLGGRNQGITEADIAKLEARLRPLFEQHAA